MVQTLESLCEVASQDGELLGYSSSGDGIEESSLPQSSSDMTKDVGIEGSIEFDGTWSLCSLLLDFFGSSDPYLGPPARNSFLILIQLSAKFPQLEKCFSKDTGLELTVSRYDFLRNVI